MLHTIMSHDKPVTSSVCSENVAYCMNGRLVSHTATVLSSKWEQLVIYLGHMICMWDFYT